VDETKRIAASRADSPPGSRSWTLPLLCGAVFAVAFQAHIFASGKWAASMEIPSHYLCPLRARGSIPLGHLGTLYSASCVAMSDSTDYGIALPPLMRLPWLVWGRAARSSAIRPPPDLRLPLLSLPCWLACGVPSPTVANALRVNVLEKPCLSFSAPEQSTMRHRTPLFLMPRRSSKFCTNIRSRSGSEMFARLTLLEPSLRPTASSASRTMSSFGTGWIRNPFILIGMRRCAPAVRRELTSCVGSPRSASSAFAGASVHGSAASLLTRRVSRFDLWLTLERSTEPIILRLTRLWGLCRSQ
jgi:hypothetical protein